MNPPSSKTVITSEAWQQKLDQVTIKKTDMNRLIMDFLVAEGYVEAARSFQQESGTPPGVDLSTVEDRAAIRQAIHHGKVQEAIDMVQGGKDREVLSALLREDKTSRGDDQAMMMVELSSEAPPPQPQQTQVPPPAAPLPAGGGTAGVPSSSGRTPAGGATAGSSGGQGAAAVTTTTTTSPNDSDYLVFHLRQQQLIELIRKGDVQGALDFATGSLTPSLMQTVEGMPEHVPWLVGGGDEEAMFDELERTVALLAFRDPSGSPCGDLLEPAQRQKTGGELNAALLHSRGLPETSRLVMLVKLLTWAQAKLDERAVYPRLSEEGLITGKLTGGAE